MATVLTFSMHNSIIWGNSPDGYTAGALVNETFSFCDIQGGLAGTGNFDADPLFVDPVGGDYRLRGDSPCVDVGSMGVPMVVTVTESGSC